MQSDIFVNIVILVSFLFFIGQFFKGHTYETNQSLKRQLVTGVIFGALGILLMFYTIHVTDTVIIDLRNIALIIAGIFGGPISAILTASIVGFFRIWYFGANNASIIGITVSLTLGVCFALISTTQQSRLRKYLYMLILTMIVTSFALCYLMKDHSIFFETLLLYWLIYLCGGFLAYFAIEYIINSSNTYKLMAYNQMMADNLLDTISTHKPDGTYIYASASAVHLLGYSPDELVGMNTYDLIHPADREQVRKFQDVQQTLGKSSNQIYRLKKKNGDFIWVETSVRNIKALDGSLKEMVCATRNIDERKKMEETLRESEERFRAAFDNSAVGATITTPEGNLIGVNKAFCDMLGYTEAEMIKTTLLDLTYPEDRKVTSSSLQKILSGEIPYYHLEKRYSHKRGYPIWVLVSLSPVKKNGKIQFMIVQSQDMSARKKAEEELQRAKFQAEMLASIDHLTGLMNRRAFEERFNVEYDRAIREEQPVSLIMTDIDYFKDINDSYGHQVGDLILKKFSKCLSTTSRPYDFVGRHGGEEFIICLPNTDCDQAVKIAERMRKAVEKLSIKLVYLQEPIIITASFGVASCKGNETNLQQLIMQADTAMYQAKNMARNRVCTFNKE